MSTPAKTAADFLKYRRVFGPNAAHEAWRLVCASGVTVDQIRPHARICRVEKYLKYM